MKYPGPLTYPGIDRHCPQSMSICTWRIFILDNQQLKSTLNLGPLLHCFTTSMSLLLILLGLPVPAPRIVRSAKLR